MYKLYFYILQWRRTILLYEINNMDLLILRTGYTIKIRHLGYPSCIRTTHCLSILFVYPVNTLSIYLYIQSTLSPLFSCATTTLAQIVDVQWHSMADSCGGNKWFHLACWKMTGQHDQLVCDISDIPYRKAGIPGRYKVQTVSEFSDLSVFEQLINAEGEICLLITSN